MTTENTKLNAPAASRSSDWLARLLTIWILLLIIDVCAYAVAKPLPEKHWQYYIPAVGGWVALYDKINSR